jgi:acyl transferase domain-containing protein
LYGFDPNFFGISPREAQSMDPQHRLLLESSFRAIEDAGMSLEKLAGQSVGVYVGISSFDQAVAALSPSDRGVIHSYSNTGGSSSIAANRISYCFDLRGPSLAIDTACSSSLVAIHLACEAMQRGECSMALVGGVNALLLPDFYVAFSQLGVLSPDGRCKAFDARANGYVRSEGAGVVLLKPLRQAIDNGDHIYAVVRGTAVNQDGRTPGLTVPSQLAQEALIHQACQRAGVHPSDISYVEAHGTGTSVGDPIEANAIGNVIGRAKGRQQACTFGSVKTNIGHLEAGAGITSFIKVALALKHGRIPKHLHFEQPNPAIDLVELGLRVPTETQPWNVSSESRLGNPGATHRIAGINGFGYGGTNAHAILEEFSMAEAETSKPSSSKPDLTSVQRWLFPVSARNTVALNHLVASNLAELEGSRELSLSKLSAGLIHHRSHFAKRFCCSASTQQELIDQWKAMVNRQQANRADESFVEDDGFRLLRSRPAMVRHGATSHANEPSLLRST